MVKVFYDRQMLQDRASGERPQDQWSSGCFVCFHPVYPCCNPILLCVFILSVPIKISSSAIFQNLWLCKLCVTVLTNLVSDHVRISPRFHWNIV